MLVELNSFLLNEKKKVFNWNHNINTEIHTETKVTNLDMKRT